jgi:hypothetical protein
MIRRRTMLLMIVVLSLSGFGCASFNPDAFNGETVFDTTATSRDRAYTSDVAQDPVGFALWAGDGVMQELYGPK